MCETSNNVIINFQMTQENLKSCKKMEIGVSSQGNKRSFEECSDRESASISINSKIERNLIHIPLSPHT